MGRDAIAAFYKCNYAEAEAGGGVPAVRQLVSNFRISFPGDDEAKADFALLLFAKNGAVPFSDYCEPVEVADVHIGCRRGADRRWRIGSLEGDRVFRRER